MSETTVQPQPRQMTIGDVLGRLGEASSVWDRRKRRDIELLLEETRGSWAGRVTLAGAFAGPQNMLFLAVPLVVDGLAWTGSKPARNNQWLAIMGLPHDYPLFRPVVRFTGTVPYCPHVAHAAFPPDEAGLPPELRRYAELLRQGQDGGCCYCLAHEWTADTAHDLRLVLSQVARMVCGARFHGEGEGALNTHAAEHFVRHAEQFPLGPALPFLGAEPAGSEEDEIEWEQG
jgi:hypothetical protein